MADLCFFALLTGKAHFIDFREKAPAAATENMYLDAQGNVIPGRKSVVGYKAVGVPGSVAGLVYAEKQYGKLSLEKVIAPAIKLARDGFPSRLRRHAGSEERQVSGPVSRIETHLSA